MTAAELLPSIADLETAESRLKTGFREVAAALLDIKNRELFRAAGFASFSAYVANRLGMEKSRAYQMLDTGEILLALETSKDSTMVERITSERQVRPLAGMPLGRKVTVLIAAAKEAERQKMPLTGKRVEDVARKFGWKPRAEWKREQQAKGGEDVDENRRILFKQLTDRMEWIATFQHRPEKAVKEFENFGGPRDWPGFVEALDYLAQLAELGAD